MNSAKKDTLVALNMKALRLVAGWRKWFIPSIMLNALFGNLSPFVTIYMSAEIVNELAGARDVSRLTRLVLFTVIADLAIAIIGQLFGKLKDCEWKSFENCEQQKFIEHGFTMDYEHLENPEIQNRRRKISESQNINSFGIGAMLYSLENVSANAIQVVLAICFASGLFVPVFSQSGDMAGSVYFLAIIAGLIGLSVFGSVRGAKKLSELGEDISNNMLTINRIGRKFGSAYQLGKDIRLYNMNGIFRKYRQQSFDAQVSGNRKYWFGHRNTQIPDLVISLAMNFVIYAYVCLNAVRGHIEIGSVIKYVGIISRLVSALKSLSADYAMVKMNEPFLRHYLEYFEIENKMYHGSLTTEKRADNEYELEFRNVSFKYPGSDVYALKNLNLRINIGRRMAVVGMNGSGKTTMIKLLCRLYDPTEGEITLNGIDIRKYEYAEYIGIFSVVFQDFKLFSFPLGQNVAAAVDYDRARAAGCLEMAGFGDRLREMSKGLDTPMYKDFEAEGVEISGGEAQKIALARALYKDAPFIVLDEPTAALDPIAEFEIYSKFNELVGDKTAIYISHRLSSCRFCDDIAVFHEGELIQRGSHEALLGDRDGKYCELWSAQAQYYVEQAPAGLVS